MEANEIKKLEKWYHLTGQVKRKLILKLLGQVLKGLKILNQYEDTRLATLDLQCDVGYLFWQSDYQAAYSFRCTRDNHWLPIGEYKLPGFLEACAEAGAISYRRDVTGYYWCLIDWVEYAICCQRFGIGRDQFRDSMPFL